MSLKKPSKRAWLRLLVTGIAILSITALAFDFPTVYNRLNTQLKNSTSISLPQIAEWPFHLGLDLQGGAHLVYEAKVDDIPQEQQEDAVAGVRDVIERRVNTMGVSEPLVQTNKVGDSYRVIVELAGVTDVNEAINRIGETPLLEFKEYQLEPDLTPEEQERFEKANEEQLQIAQDALDQILGGADFVEFVHTFSSDTASREQDGSLGWFGRGIMVPPFEEAVFALEVGQVTDELVETQFGYHIIKKDDARTNEETGEEEIMASHILIPNVTAQEIAGDRGATGFVSTGLAGNHLERAQTVFDPHTGAPQVSLNFNEEGTELFRDITQRNINRPVAIYLDGMVISSPTVNNIISNGEAVITGQFTLDEAKQLAIRLNQGALPTPIELLSQQTIGASLGEASLKESLQAGLFGLLFVILFMLLIYRIPGLLAVLALVAYASIVLLAFKLIPVTLTLSGIAGFILSVGMAVDANVLIFERIRESLRDGNQLQTAINEGFAKAWPSIRDGNVSTLITCMILATFGTSMIQGFAVTLAIGVILSMGTAVYITRSFVTLVLKWKWVQNRLLLGMKQSS